MIRLFLNTSFEPNQKISLSAPQSHYLTHVMRLKEGEEIICFNGKQGDWIGFLKKQKKEYFFSPQKQITEQQKRPECLLCMSLIKRDPLVLTLQKATELGATQIHLIQADRSNNERVNMERLKAIIVEACEQCERNDIPTLFTPVSLDKKIKELQEKAQFVWLSERGTTSGKMGKLPPAFFVGPEGGWSEREQQILTLNQALSWHLGNTILRAETAAITALGLWQYKSEIKTLAI